MTPILLYHQITAEQDHDDPFALSVTPENFEAQMRYLADNNYRCLSLKEAIARRSGQKDSGKTFALTFDDGYADNYEIAFPILKKFGFKATIFVVSGFVGRSLCWPGEREVAFCTWEQLDEMWSYGIEMGGHTSSHPNLPELSLAEAEFEIRDSKSMLEKHLKRPVLHFAYPGGHQTPHIQDITMATGYEAGLGVDIGPNSQFNTWRVQITGNDSLALFRLKVSGRFEQLKRIRHSSKMAHQVTQLAGNVLNRLRG